jgi:hypothetical protein
VKKTILRAAAALAVLAVVFLVIYWWNTRDLPGPMGEVIQPNEDVQIAKLVAASTALATQDHYEHLKSENDPTWRRDVHGHTPGCIKARFTVLKTDDRFKFGLFSLQPPTAASNDPAYQYEAWIRFSNGNHQLKPDTESDVRGVALKVMGVTKEKFGPKLLEGEEDADTQDFALMNSPVYFFRDLADYAQFSGMLSWGAANPKARWLGKLAPSGATGRDILPFFRYSWNPFNWNLRSLISAVKAQIKPPPSPLHIQYFSASAYALGPRQYVKYSMRPCQENYLKNAPPRPTTPNGLHEALKQTLSQGDWCFYFMAQLQVPGKNMPVEDASVLWSESDSPFVPVARIDIPRQDVPDQPCFCENLAMNPWHSLPAHRPVGVFNRIRKNIYQESARFRRAHQGAPQREPTGIQDTLAMPCRVEPASNSVPKP